MYPLEFEYCNFKNSHPEVKEMAKQLRALVVLGKNPCLIPSTHMGAYNCL